MTQYYFLISAFPPLTLGTKPELAFRELKQLLGLNLSPRDLQKVQLLLRPIDLYNMRALWLGLPLDDRGNFDAKDLEEALLVRDSLPLFIVDYLDRYESIPERLRNFSSLYVSLYREGRPELKGFLLKYYQMEREIRLVLTALRAKRGKRDLVRELQFEDPYDPFVAEILAQKDAPDFTPPQEYEDLKTIFMGNISEPQRLHRTIVEYRFEKIEEMEEPHDLGIDRVLAYIARLILLESLNEQDREKGITALEQLSQYG